ncbi:hypothetical protein [Enterococcus crotali]|uniref:hypothetical protein n=1 Tax=Enterococcus crotali TaxID=1453587 RepID=UPI00046FFA15|nr:hypothetical protein [Enterococcus crotali]
MIIWQGKGGLVFLSLILGAMVTTVIFGFLPIDTGYKAGYILEGVVMTVVVAVVNHLFTKKFISDNVKIFIDEETGERIQVKDRSSLFFIPNKYWTWIILVFGIILTISSSSVYN